MAGKLVWNEVSEGEWHAGGLTRHFSITRTDAGSFSLRVRTGDNPSIRVNAFATLKIAQARAQRISDGGLSKAEAR
jgi:hypothetical protein